MEEMKNFECAICGKMHNNIKSRIACETQCLAEQEKMQKKMAEDTKNKQKKEDEANINKELDILVKQYDKVVGLISAYYEKYDNEDIYTKVTSRYIPKTFFDFIF
jgi:hypothetical protein